jgi:hypothetical protein
MTGSSDDSSVSASLILNANVGHMRYVPTLDFHPDYDVKGGSLRLARTSLAPHWHRGPTQMLKQCGIES